MKTRVNSDRGVLRRRIRSLVLGVETGDPERSALGGKYDRCFLLPTKTEESGVLDRLPLEDQEGDRLAFADFFRGKPSVVVFFYTRCDDLRKCSLTISKLAQLQQAINSRGLTGRIKTAGFTYDPKYDSASRLKIYGRDRGMRFDEDNRLFALKPASNACKRTSSWASAS